MLVALRFETFEIQRFFGTEVFAMDGSSDASTKRPLLEREEAIGNAGMVLVSVGQGLASHFICLFQRCQACLHSLTLKLQDPGHFSMAVSWSGGDGPPGG